MNAICKINVKKLREDIEFKEDSGGYAMGTVTIMFDAATGKITSSVIKWHTDTIDTVKKAKFRYTSK